MDINQKSKKSPIFYLLEAYFVALDNMHKIK